jgi:signal transduction histidine kinase
MASQSTPPPQAVSYPLLLAVLAVVYFGAAKASLVLAIPPGYATAVWPPAGIALVFLWRGGLRLWPGVLVGAAAANYTIAHSLPAALAIGLGNSLEAVAGAWLAQRLLADARGPFSQPLYTLRFFLLCLGAALIAATVGIASLMALDQTEDFVSQWGTWWLGDATGMMVVAPLLVAWIRPGRVVWTPPKMAEGAIMLGLLALVSTEIFFGWAFGAHGTPLSYLLVPFIIWAAIRFAAREAFTLCALVSLMALVATVTGSGPFAGRSLNESLILQQIFVSTLVATGMVLAALMRNLRRASETMRLAREEMEHMVHLAAHDLQEPLRTVESFSDLLRLKYHDRLDAEAQELIRFITGGAERARQLIEDLLAVSEAGRRPLALEEVDSNAALAAALSSMKGSLEASGARVHHDGLPVVRADRRMLESLFQNLVGNAVKHRGERPPRIDVSAHREPRAWQFSVRDNGPGIDPRHHERIFQMFERLGGEGVSGSNMGSGAGLTLCSTIVSRHGGRIWVESAASQGAVFHFTLPIGEHGATP